MKRIHLLSIFFGLLLALVLGHPIQAQFGSVDPTFNPADSISGFDGAIDVFEILPDGKMVVVGGFRHYNKFPVFNVARLNPDFTLDRSFHSPGGFSGTLPNQLTTWQIWEVAVQKDGKILIVGNFDKFNGIAKGGILRLNTDGSVDNSFKPILEGMVTDVVVQQNQKIILSISNVGTNVIRLLPDGTLDPTFEAPYASNSEDYYIEIAQKLLLQEDDKLFVIGPIGSKKGGARADIKGDGPGIMRLHPDGALDSSFSVGDASYENISDACIGSDGKIVLLGDFRMYYDPSVLPYSASLVRLHPDGSRDLGFAPDSSKWISTRSMDVQPDGKVILIVRCNDSFCDFNQVVRLNIDGLLDTSIVSELMLESKIKALNNEDFVVSTPFSSDNINNFNHLGQGSFRTAHYDHFENTGVNDFIYDMCVQPDGKLLLGGDFTKINGAKLFKIARLLPDGTIDRSFKTNHLVDTLTSRYEQQIISDIDLQADGKIIVAGNIAKVNGKKDNSIVRLHANGEFDSTFHMVKINRRTQTDYEGDIRANIFDLQVRSDGKILVAGDFQSVDGDSVLGIIRLDSDGQLDPTFQADKQLDSTIDLIYIQKDQKILIHQESNGIVRLHPNGRIDSSFHIEANIGNFVLAVAQQSDGKILVAGYKEPYLFRLHPDGKIDTSFHVGKGFNHPVYSLLILEDQKIIAGGSFVQFNGVQCNSVICLHPDGRQETNFDVGEGFTRRADFRYAMGDCWVTQLRLQPNNKIIASGSFDHFASEVRNNIVRLNGNEAPTGLLDESLFARRNESGFTIYPNPSKGTVKLLLNNGIANNGVTLLVRDAIGQVKLELRNVQPHTEMDLNHLPKGIYLIELAGGAQAKSCKLIIE